MARLTRNAILGTSLRTKSVEVPEWGGDVEIRELSLRQQQLIAAANRGADGNTNVAIATFLEGVVDPQFTAADAEALASQGIAAFQRVVNEIVELSGMAPNADKAIAGK